MVKKYVHKPIEAIQYIVGSEVPIMEFLGLTDKCKKNYNELIWENENAYMIIHQPEVITLEIKTLVGRIKVHNRDYIIKNDNSFYSCSEDIFKELYIEYNETY